MRQAGRITKYLISMAAVFFILICIDVVSFAIIHWATKNSDISVPIGRISADLSSADGEYTMTSETKREIDKYCEFAMLIDEKGRVVWKYKLPDDVPTKYTIMDVSSFSHWYLNDYPVYTWVRNDGIFVVGMKKHSQWRYNIIYEISTLDLLIKYFPVILILNMLALVIIPLFITKRWNVKNERERTEWIAGVSHDIRTPLSLVFASTAEIKKCGLSETQNKYIDIIENQSVRIRDLVANLNTANKLKFGNINIRSEKIAVSALIRSIMCDYINQQNDDKYTFECEIKPNAERFEVYADRGLMTRMIENLISNAVRHNPQGCTITAMLCAEGKNKAELIIYDNGTGVSAEKLRQLNRRDKGKDLPEHGLGLRVVKQTAGRYHWKTEFLSEQGHSFSCRILMKGEMKE